MKQKISPKICKRNMKLFPFYRAISYDFLFFYTINFLFLTQIKNISPSAVVIEDAFYSLFVIILQIPAVLIIDLFGRKKSILLGNISNIIYMTLFLCSDNLLDLIIAEIFSAIAFSLKDVSDLSLLNESIPPTSKKSKIFAKLTSKGLSGYFVLNSISLIISGFLFTINGYIPIITSLAILIIAFLISCIFIDPVPEEKTDKIEQEKTRKQQALKDVKESLNDLVDSFKFIFSSSRLRALISFSSTMAGLITIMVSYQVSLLEELGVSASIIGIVFAFLEITASISSKKQEKFHNKFRKKSLSVLGITICFACMLAGISGYISKNIYIASIIAIFAFAVKYSVVGIYQILIDRYYRNFTNADIDSKVFSAKSLFNSISSAILGIIASILLEITNTQNSLIIISILFLILFTISICYMKNKLGLNPEEYSEKELQFAKVDILKTAQEQKR